MLKGKTLIIMLAMLTIGFVGGFILRSAMTPAQPTVVAANPALVPQPLSDARGTQYFVAHIDEARQIVTGCRDGSVRGAECATAEEAIIKVEAQERRKRFLGN